MYHKRISSNLKSNAENPSDIDSSATDRNNNKSYCNHIKKCELVLKKFSSLKQRYLKLKKENRYLKSKNYIKKVMKAKLSEKSINAGTVGMLVSGGKKSKMYRREDISVAAVLKSMSRKAYRFIRKRKLLRLPCESSIQNWIRKFRTNCGGVQNELIDILTAKHGHIQRDTYAFLSFDEMSLKSRWVYDSSNRVVRAPAKKLQCVIARGVITGWKIPVYFSNDFGSIENHYSCNGGEGFQSFGCQF